MTRPRAAEDFTVIRARMEDLKRERTGLCEGDDTRHQQGPRPYAVSSQCGARDRSGLSRAAVLVWYPRLGQPQRRTAGQANSTINSCKNCLS